MKRRDFLKALATAPLVGVVAKKTEPQLLMKDVDGWVKKNDRLFHTRPVTIYDISTNGMSLTEFMNSAELQTMITTTWKDIPGYNWAWTQTV